MTHVWVTHTRPAESHPRRVRLSHWIRRLLGRDRIRLPAMTAEWLRTHDVESAKHQG